MSSVTATSPDDIWGAVKRGDLEKVREFAHYGLLPTVEDDYDSQSLLTYSCAVGQVDIVRFLWNEGIRSSSIVGRAPEAFAALENGHIDVLRLLCKFGLDPYSTRYSKHGDYLIDFAIEQRNAEVVRLLLTHGGNIFSEYEEEMTAEERESEDDPPTPLELAARAGDLEFVEFLLEVGVELKGQEPDYYLEKAQQNAPKFQHAQLEKEKAEEKQRVESEARVKQADRSCFATCLALTLVTVAFFWLVSRLFSWLGWQATAFTIGLVSVFCIVMRVCRWGQA